MNFDEEFMKVAIKQAKRAELIDEVPIGAVIVKDGKIIARGHNERQTKNDSTLHAEIVAIKKACKKLGSWRLIDCSIYVTLEPCPMCAGAIVNSRIERVVFGAYDQKAGSVRTLYNIADDERLNHRAQITGGVLQDECGQILSEYFKNKRSQK